MRGAGVMQGRAGRVEDQGGAAEDVVHVAHENRRHAVQAEGTDPELILATGDAKRGLVLILRADPELHVGHRQIELGEEACAACLIAQLVDVRQRCDRLLRDGVEPTVIVADARRHVPSAFRANTTEAA